MEERYPNLKYGEIYEFYAPKRGIHELGLVKGVYIGNDSGGMGKILFREEYPMVCSFNLRKAILEEKLIKNVSFNKLYLSSKEKSFALEILNKKSL